MKKIIAEHKSNSQIANYTECCIFQINNDRVRKKCTPVINIIKWVYVFNPQFIVRFAHPIIFHGSLFLRSLRRNQPD